jgi:peptide/nickel transport system substrate-binding protein
VGPTQGFNTWDCNQDPLSNGPYILEEWDRGNNLTFVRNPNYFEEGKPYIDKVYFQIVPEVSVRKTMMAEKAADIDFWANSEDAAELDVLDHISYDAATATRWLVHLWFNLASYGEIDPVASPHPVLSDVRVRQAMRMALDTDSVAAGVWPDGSIKHVWTEFFRPPYNECDIPKPVFDPAAAGALLEEAGWTDTDGDGVRECHGCTTGAPEGFELALEFTAWSEFGDTLILAQQLMGEYMEAVGFDITLSQETGAVLWETYDNGGLEQNGLFDMVMWDDGYAGSDPTEHIWCYFHSDAAEPDACWNVMRFMNEDFDALSDESWTIDEEYRKELFCGMAEILDEELPAIPLFDASDITIYNNRIEGPIATVNAMVTWNIADWKIVK